jgi:glycosyltransferase involved in cell wall biosynthesis
MLKGALDSIAKQNLSQQCFEIIVVDNGSTDETKQVVDSFMGKILNLRYFYEETPGLHVGRHKGLKEARSNILVYADDDIEAFPTWLEAIAETFEDESVGLVGGKVLPKFEVVPPDWLLDMWEKETGNGKILPSLSIIDIGDVARKISPLYVFGCNFAIRKSILMEAKGFHPDGMPQDMIRYRGDGETHVARYIMKKGYTSIYRPMASVYHIIPESRMTEDYFCRRAYNEGISKSYTQIRNFREITKWIMKLRRIKHCLIYGFSNKIEAKIQKAYWDGYFYHQCEVKNDPSLYKWIIKKNYID